MIYENLKPYRKSKRIQELYKLMESRKNQQNCLIWQNLDGDRCVYCHESLSLNSKYKTCMFTFKENPAFTPQKPIYVRFEDGLMFKTKMLNCFEECLTIFLPEEFMAYENRFLDRIHFKAIDAKYAHINLVSDVLQSANQELAFQLIDLSTDGMAINMPDTFLKRLTHTEKIQLKKLFMVNLAKSIECEIIYVKPFKYKLEGIVYKSNRVGIRFLTPIDEYLLKISH